MSSALGTEFEFDGAAPIRVRMASARDMEFLDELVGLVPCEVCGRLERVVDEF